MVRDGGQRLALAAPTDLLTVSSFCWPASERDTTDRSLITGGKEAGFDPLGFRNDVGMQRDLFYYSPFLSCRFCNTIAFVDSAALRAGLIHDLPPVKGVREVSGLG